MKYFTRTFLIFCIGFLLTFTSKAQNSYSIIYEADRNGKAITGSIEQLMNYVQNGNPIRVGWVLRFPSHIPDEKGDIIEMQHWADAGFITTLRGHVFAQISSIFQQGPFISNPPGVLLTSNKANGWVAIIGTTGVIKQKYLEDEVMIAMMKKNGMTEEQIKEQLKEQETMKVHTKWAIQQTK